MSGFAVALLISINMPFVFCIEGKVSWWLPKKLELKLLMFDQQYTVRMCIKSNSKVADT